MSIPNSLNGDNISRSEVHVTERILVEHHKEGTFKASSEQDLLNAVIPAHKIGAASTGSKSWGTVQTASERRVTYSA